MYLVVKKTSQLDIRRDSLEKMSESGILKGDQLERFHRAHEEHMKTYGKLIEELTNRNIEFREVVRGEEWPDFDKVKSIITVGGDGTVLEASHHLRNTNVSLIGVRSSSMSVGFLCYVSENEISLLGEQLENDSVNFMSVDRLHATITKYNGEMIETAPVLNDFLYTNKNPAETTRYVFDFEGNKELHKSSGIWVATAAGSTAAIHAAGGTVYPIEDENFQFVIREPYCPPGGCYLKTKSEFTPEKNNIVIENRCDSAFLALDGHHGMVELDMGDVISFERSSKLRIARQL